MMIDEKAVIRTAMSPNSKNAWRIQPRRYVRTGRPAMRIEKASSRSFSCTADLTSSEIGASSEIVSTSGRCAPNMTKKSRWWYAAVGKGVMSSPIDAGGRAPRTAPGA